MCSEVNLPQKCTDELEAFPSDDWPNINSLIVEGRTLTLAYHGCNQLVQESCFNHNRRIVENFIIFEVIN